MKHEGAFHPTVVIYAGSPGVASVSAPGFGDGMREFSPRFHASGVVDPHALAKAWPDRWSAYLRAAFRSERDVARAFDVSERAAGFWWRAETGCKASHLVVALRRDPERAAAMLIGEGA